MVGLAPLAPRPVDQLLTRVARRWCVRAALDLQAKSEAERNLWVEGLRELQVQLLQLSANASAQIRRASVEAAQARQAAKYAAGKPRVAGCCC